MEGEWKRIVLIHLCVGVLLVYLLNLQPVAPDSLQQVTETGDECVLLHTGDADLTVTELHRFPAHLLHQHALCLDQETQSRNRTIISEVTTYHDVLHSLTDPWCADLLSKPIFPTTYLISALLQETLHKLPVGLSNDRRGQVGQFGLADGSA